MAMSFRLALLLAFAPGFPPAPASSAQPGKPIRITILHTNDIHGWIMPRAAAFYKRNPRRLIGGAAALAAYAKKIKGPKLVLDAGDWFLGTPEGSLERGRAMAGVLNSVGYDALEAGNHEFDYGEKSLSELIKALHAPVLCANVYRAEGRRAPECRPWIVKEVSGVKVGVFGLLTPYMKGRTAPENIAGLSFRRPSDEAKDDVAALRKEGATVIIALTHLGFESPDGPPLEGDQTLASEVAGIDLIVGGHSHTALQKPVRDAAYGTLITQAGAYLTRVGVATLEIDAATKKVLRSSDRLVDLWLDETGEDPATAKAVAGLSEEVKRRYDVVVATAQASLSRNRDGESPLGDWMTDCERAWTGVDLAILNGGGIRGDIEKGPVTMRRIHDAAPFDNHVVTLVMKGKDLRSLLDHGVGLGAVAQVSGAKLSFHRGAPAGKRLETVSIGGRALVDGSTYTVASVDYLVHGGDGYAAFKSAESENFTKTSLQEVLKWCALKQARIEAPPAGRLLPLGN